MSNESYESNKSDESDKSTNPANTNEYGESGYLESSEEEDRRLFCVNVAGIARSAQITC